MRTKVYAALGLSTLFIVPAILANGCISWPEPFQPSPSDGREDGGGVDGTGIGGSNSSSGSMEVKPPDCSDNKKNGSETDRDCGGSCPPCSDGKVCVENQDCESKVCDGGKCQTPSCTDQAQNGTETGVDCGGSCGECNGTSCSDASACASGFCVDGLCCDTTCITACMSCATPDFPGTCAQLNPASKRYVDDPGACEGAMTCNTSGKCLKKAMQPCTNNSECASGHCVAVAPDAGVSLSECRNLVGEPCTSDYECISNHCKSGFCGIP